MFSMVNYVFFCKNSNKTEKRSSCGMSILNKVMKHHLTENSIYSMKTLRENIICSIRIKPTCYLATVDEYIPPSDVFFLLMAIHLVH